MNKINKANNEIKKIKQKAYPNLIFHLMLTIILHALIFWMAIFYRMQFSNLEAIVFFANPFFAVVSSQIILVLVIFTRKLKNNDRVFIKILFWYLTSNVMFLMSSICMMFVTFLRFVLPGDLTANDLTTNILLFIMSIIIIFAFNYFSIYRISPIYKNISSIKNKAQEQDDKDINKNN